MTASPMLPSVTRNHSCWAASACHIALMFADVTGDLEAPMISTRL